MAAASNSLRRRVLLKTLGSGMLAGVAGCVSKPRGNSEAGPQDWPYPHFSAKGTSYNPALVGPRSKPSESWGVEVTGFSRGRPIVHGQTVYYASDRRIRAFDVEDGTELWAFETEIDYGFRSPLTVDSDHVYIGQTGTRPGVLALSHDGEEVWHAPTESGVWAPIIKSAPDSDHLFAADTDGYIFRIRTTDGRIDWKTRVFGPIRALAGNHSAFAVGTEGGEVSMFLDEGPDQEPTGLWRTKLPGGIQALSAGRAGDVFAGAFGGGVARLEEGLHAGAVRWHQEEPSPHKSVVVGPKRVFATDGLGLHAYNERTGEDSWFAEGDFFAPPAGAGDTIFVSETSEDGGVIAFDRSGGVGVDSLRFGVRRWRYALDGGAETGPTPAHDALFVVESGDKNESARLVALRAE
ncbi:PQQ-binding-like beta-propeller repeat protein [Haloferax sp. DFSO60]|uniref:outer membrane protein assembly factor BamB family protein n=1 Tax=Haloferax sp. DFSO60 TaxID=3388652 RepID=UPI00397DA4C4